MDQMRDNGVFVIHWDISLGHFKGIFSIVFRTEVYFNEGYISV